MKEFVLAIICVHLLLLTMAVRHVADRIDVAAERCFPRSGK